MALPAQRVDAIRSIMAQARAVGGVEREMAATLSVLAANAQSRIDVLEATAIDWLSPDAVDLYIPSSATTTSVPGMAYQLDSLGYDLMAFFSCELYNTSPSVSGEALVALNDAGTIYTPGMRQATLDWLAYTSVSFMFAWRPPAGLRTVSIVWACAPGLENLIRCTGGRMQLTLMRMAFGGL
jgi:hypothetical protein